MRGNPYRFALDTGEYYDNVIVYAPALSGESLTVKVYVISAGVTQEVTGDITYVSREDGKGVIYQMIDEYDNEAQYDFKGIQFKRYKILSIANKEFNEEFYSATIKNKYKNSEMIIDENDYIWCYLFSAFLDDKIVDFSVNIINGRPRKNIFKTTKLMNGVILYKDFNIAATCGNYCGEYCINWTAGTNTSGYNNEGYSTQEIFRVGNNCSNWIVYYDSDIYTKNNTNDFIILKYGITCDGNCHGFLCAKSNIYIEKNNSNFAVFDDYGGFDGSPINARILGYSFNYTNNIPDMFSIEIISGRGSSTNPLMYITANSGKDIKTWIPSYLNYE